MTIRLKRVYEEPAKSDGTRILVDRLWPRGLTKEKAHIDLWLKEVAPTDDLRKWFGHDPARWPEFRARYRAELAGRRSLLELARRASDGPVTILYAARDQQHNNAVVLADVLRDAGRTER